MIRLLMVEDQKHDFILSRRTLEKSSLECEIIWVQRGADALQVLGEQAIDVITLDFNLPDMTGLDLFVELLAHNIQIPVIFLTGSGNEMVAVEALKKGAQDYLVKDPAGQYLELLPTVLDKTYRQWQNRLAQERAEELEKKFQFEQERSRILATFITKASHEFRTPLAVMKTSLYLLSKTPDEAKRQTLLQRLDGRVDDITLLVDNLVKMARIDGIEAFETDPLSLNDIIHQVLESTHARDNAQHYDFVVHLADDLPLIQGSFLELKDVFEALIDNAIRFTPDGGNIRVTTAIESDYVVVTIIDDGIGMTDEQLAQAFERFYRADEAHSTRGFGLGLSMAKAIVEKHDGIISAESVFKQGSTFHVRLKI